MKLFIILGNQLFPDSYLEDYKKNFTFFMAEDFGLCSHQKPNKKKILLFLSSMRSYADKLRENDFQIIYQDIDDPEFESPYIKKLEKIIRLYNIESITFFEIEDKFFESSIIRYLSQSKIDFNMIKSPMFLTSRDEFSQFLLTNKPFMATFYK